MGCGGSKEAEPPPQHPAPNTPSRQSQKSRFRQHLEELGLEQYEKPFQDIGYDDVEDLEEMTQDQLLELASRIGMLEGHARKWVKSLTKQAVSPSKIDLIFNGERSSPNPMNRRASSQVANVGEQQPQQKTSVGEDTIAQGATYDINYDKGDTNEGQQVTDGDKAIFYFIKAAKLRTCEDKVLPKMQDLRRQKPDWFVEKEISLDKAVNHEYVDKVLSVSHRWEKPGDPDIKGVQFAAIKTHLNSPQGKKFELVWMDYYCAPQKERNAEEERIFEQTLRFISHLFLGSSILILCDRTYTTRFWTLFEAWLSMQTTTANGLKPAAKDKRRCSIVPIHLASDLTAKELESMMGNKTVDEAYDILDSPDINVTNQKDKGQQLTKLLALDAQVSQAMQPAAPPAQKTERGFVGSLFAEAQPSARQDIPGVDARLKRLIEQVKIGKSEAATALADMKTDAGRQAIIAAGGIPPLIAMISKGTTEQKTEGGRALMSIGAIADGQVALAKAGAIDPLIKLATTGTTKEKEQAAGALRNISITADNRVPLVKAGCITPLVELQDRNDQREGAYGGGSLGDLRRPARASQTRRVGRRHRAARCSGEERRK